MVQTFCEFNQLTEQMMISTYASFEATIRVVILGSEFKMKASLVIIIVWHTHSQTLREVFSCNSHFFSCALGRLCIFFFLYGCVAITSNKRIFFNRLFGNKTIFTSQWMYGVARAVRLKPRLQVPDVVQNLPGVDKLDSSEQGRAKQVAILMRFISVEGDGRNSSF